MAKQCRRQNTILEVMFTHGLPPCEVWPSSSGTTSANSPSSCPLASRLRAWGRWVWILDSLCKINQSFLTSPGHEGIQGFGHWRHRACTMCRGTSHGRSLHLVNPTSGSLMRLLAWKPRSIACHLHNRSPSSDSYAGCPGRTMAAMLLEQKCPPRPE